MSKEKEISEERKKELLDWLKNSGPLDDLPAKNKAEEDFLKKRIEIRLLTKEAVERIDELGEENLTKEIKRTIEEWKRRKRRKNEPKVVGTCRYCEGDVVENVVMKRTGPRVFGPGDSKNRRRVIEGYYCKECGLVYRFPSPKKGDKNE